MQKKVKPNNMYTKDDSFGNFNRAASLHVVNKTSMEYLEKKVRANHETLENFDGLGHWHFRPNMVIDTGEVFSEDYLVELRASNVLLRFVGPTIRCNVIRINAANGKVIGENEPISTLSKFRAFRGAGVAFGNYYAIDMLQSKDVYEYIMPSNKGYSTFEEQKR